MGLKICAKFFLKIPPSITMYYDIIKDDVLDLDAFGDRVILTFLYTSKGTLPTFCML